MEQGLMSGFLQAGILKGTKIMPPYLNHQIGKRTHWVKIVAKLFGNSLPGTAQKAGLGKSQGISPYPGHQKYSWNHEQQLLQLIVYHF